MHTTLLSVSRINYPAEDRYKPRRRETERCNEAFV